VELAASQDVYLWMMARLSVTEIVVNNYAVFVGVLGCEFSHNPLSYDQHVTEQLYRKHVADKQ